MSKKTTKKQAEKAPEQPTELTTGELEAVAGGCCPGEAADIAVELTTADSTSLEASGGKCCKCH